MLLPDPEKDLEFNIRRRERVMEALTERESEFIAHLGDPEELSNKAIADRMNVCLDRVGEYAKNVREKFKINTKYGLVQFACAWRLVPMYHWHEGQPTLTIGRPGVCSGPPLVHDAAEDRSAEAVQ